MMLDDIEANLTCEKIKSKEQRAENVEETKCIKPTSDHSTNVKMKIQKFYSKLLKFLNFHLHICAMV